MAQENKYISVLNALSQIFMNGPMLRENRDVLGPVINETMKAFPNLLDILSEKYNIICSGGIYMIYDTIENIDNKILSDQVLAEKISVKDAEIDDLRHEVCSINMAFEELCAEFDELKKKHSAYVEEQYYANLHEEIHTLKELVDAKNKTISVLEEKLKNFENKQCLCEKQEKQEEKQEEKGKKERKPKANKKANKKAEKQENAEVFDKEIKKDNDFGGNEIKNHAEQEVMAFVPVLNSYKQAVLVAPKLSQTDMFDEPTEDVPFNLSNVGNYENISPENLFRADVSSAKKTDNSIVFVFRQYHIWDYSDLEIYGDVKICYHNDNPFIHLGEYVIGNNGVLYETHCFEDGIERYIPAIRKKRLLKYRLKEE